MSEIVQKQINETGSINVIPADFSIVQRQLKYPMIIGIRSKNLFDLQDITTGYYVNSSTGVLISLSSCSASNYIPIQPSTIYSISGTTEQLAFYDLNKTYISGITKAGANITTPSSACYIRLSMLNTQISSVQLEVGATVTTYETFTPKVDSTLIKGRISESKLDTLLIRGIKSKNLFDKSNIVTGYYVYYKAGNLFPLSKCSASDYIPIQPNTVYSISGTTEQLAFYDSNKTYISGLTKAGSNITMPSNAYYIRLSMINTQISSVQLEVGATATTYETFTPKIDNYSISIENIELLKQSLIKLETTILVKSDGTGDFTNPVDATKSITDASENKIYNVLIYESDTPYDIISCLDSSFLTNPQPVENLRGWEIPDYVNIIGVGNRDKIWIKGEITDITNTNAIEIISTINMCRNSNLENLKITAKNLRYAIHDESSNAVKDYTRQIKNCYIEHFGNEDGTWLYAAAYGEGCSSGSYSKFDNCTFVSIAKYGIPYSTHNNINFSKPSIHKFINCSFIHRKGLICFRTGSMGSNQKDLVYINGCSFVGAICQKEEIGGSKVGIDFVVRGSGNTKTSHKIVNTDGKYYYTSFVEEISLKNNTNTTIIPKGTLVKLKGIGEIEPLNSTDNYSVFYGITVEDIAVGEFGGVRYSGYIDITDTKLTGIVTIGSYIGIENGQLAVISDRNLSIGKVEIDNYIKI